MEAAKVDVTITGKSLPQFSADDKVQADAGFSIF
jgi:hypothetical protein